MKKQFRSAASSGRAAPGANPLLGFGSSFETHASPLSYVYEPPDLSSISDPKTVVHFKNLMKKDATTKSKALEDIQSTITSSDQEPDEALLPAWVKLYPRLSIDTSRRVRQLAHTVLGHLTSRSGKRTGPFLPQIIGPWLSGTFDLDKAVARAAQEALRRTFTTSEKLQNVWRALHRPIIEYARDTIVNETPQSLSDERIVSKEDAQATHSRVISTSLALVTTLITDQSAEELGKYQDIYSELLGHDRVWSLAIDMDATTKRAVYRLVTVITESDSARAWIDLPLASTTLISKGFTTDQTTTAGDLVKAVTELTLQQPSIWTSAYKSKKSPESRLRTFFSKGSQSSPAGFWQSLIALVDIIPAEALPRDASAFETLMQSLLEGVSSRDERLHAAAAWNAYFRIFDILARPLGDAEKTLQLQKFVLPVVDGYLNSKTENAKFALAGSSQDTIAAGAIRCAGLPDILSDEWAERTTAVIDAVKSSLPEQSKDFASSQDGAASLGQRYLAFQVESRRLQSDLPSSLDRKFVSQLERLVMSALDLLVSRRGKPYSAAIILESIERQSAALKLDPSAQDAIIALLRDHAQGMLESPSSRYLVNIIYRNLGEPSGPAVFDAWVAGLTKSPANDRLKLFLAPARSEEARLQIKQNEMLQSILLQQFSTSSDDAAYLLGHLSDPNKQEVLVKAMASLSIQDTQLDGLDVLQRVDEADSKTLSDFIADTKGRGLIAKLGELESASSPEVSEIATTLHYRLVGDFDGDTPKPVSMDLIRSELQSATSSSVPLSTIVAMTTRAAQDHSGDLMAVLDGLLDQWDDFLSKASLDPPDPTLSIMQPLGSLALLVEPIRAAAVQPAEIDGQGLSLAMRSASFALTALESSSEVSKQHARILKLLSWTAEIMDDAITIADGTNPFLRVSASQTEALVVDFIAKARQYVNENLVRADRMSPLYESFLEMNKPSSSNITPLDVVKARVYLKLMSERLEANGYSKDDVQDAETSLNTARRGQDITSVITQAAILAPHLGRSSELQKYVNRLVSDLTTADPKSKIDVTLIDAIVLNTIFQSADDTANIVAKQRLVYYLKHVTSWLIDDEVIPPVRSEIFASLQKILPLLGDLYGEHWGQILGAMSATWSKSFFQGDVLDEMALCLVSATLQLYDVLVNMAGGEDANEDLLDAMKEHRKALEGGILKLLCQDQSIDDSKHTPLAIVNSRIARMARKITDVPVEIAADLFPLLDAKSRSIQDAVFTLLQKHTESVQQQVAVDAALADETAHLPEELLSFVLTSPSIDEVMDASFETSIPESLHSYLYSWLLIFSHFTKATAKVREGYADDIKSGNYLSPLLDLTFTFLGHSTGKPINASNLNITHYTRGTEESPKRDTQWLMVHLYYLALLYLPSLSRTYYLSITNRLTSSSISTWTAKHISSQIISAALESAQSWATSFASDPEYEDFSLKTSLRGREITASYLVDEQTMSIAIRFPDAYPLAGASVESIVRVAIDQRRWNSWLRSCAGVIQFSNGDVVEGLSTWRRNVAGQLRGKGECAICYSIVSGDRQLPTKRCTTCKKLFHSMCLFKWFKSSGGNSCPLCRQAFKFD